MWLCFWKVCWLLHSNIGDCMLTLGQRESKGGKTIASKVAGTIGCGSKLREKGVNEDPYRRSDPATPLAWSSVTYKNLAVHQSRWSSGRGEEYLRIKGGGAHNSSDNCGANCSRVLTLPCRWVGE